MSARAPVPSRERAAGVRFREMTEARSAVRHGEGPMRADGRGRRECRGNARGPGRIRGVAPRGPGLPARSACAHGTAGGAEPNPCRRWRLRRRKRRRVRPVRAYVAREGEHPRRPDGRPRARGGGGLWARSASARKDRGPERSARRPETAARRDRERSALRAVAEGTLRAAGDREASASGPRREGGRRAEPRGARGRLRGDATSPAGCRATRAGRVRARRGERTREAPLPALPADAERARDGARISPVGCSSGGVRTGGGVRGPYALSPPLPSIQHFRMKMCDKTGEHAAVPARSGTIFCA